MTFGPVRIVDVDIVMCIGVVELYLSRVAFLLTELLVVGMPGVRR